MTRKRFRDEDNDINITPMLDVVFIMVIIIVVTTVCVREESLEVALPSNSPLRETMPYEEPITLNIDADGSISVEGRVLEAAALYASLEREKARRPTAPLLIAAHPGAGTEMLVVVVDAARAAGITTIDVESTEP